MYKKIDRLKFRMCNVFYGQKSDQRVRTPMHLQIAEQGRSMITEAMSSAFNRKIINENHRHMAKRAQMVGLSVDDLQIAKKKSTTTKGKKKGKS
jgi:hypothetical protein